MRDRGENDLPWALAIIVLTIVGTLVVIWFLS